MNRGDALVQLARAEDALPDYDASVHLLEELVKSEGWRELRGDLAWASARHAGLLLRMGLRGKGCQEALQAMSILQSEVTRTGRADLRQALEFAEEVARHAND
jgi:hypothetical protein